MLYDEWVDAYESAYEDPGTLPGLACPSCGAKTLYFRFPMLPKPGDREGAGYSAFWCGTCVRGLRIRRTEVPPWAWSVVEDEVAAAAQKVGIPNYKFIEPPEFGADEGVSMIG